MIIIHTGQSHKFVVQHDRNAKTETEHFGSIGAVLGVEARKLARNVRRSVARDVVGQQQQHRLELQQRRKHDV